MQVTCSRPGRGARVDDRGGLENRCGLWVTVGSNPTPSASIARPKRPGCFILLTYASEDTGHLTHRKIVHLSNRETVRVTDVRKGVRVVY